MPRVAPVVLLMVGAAVVSGGCRTSGRGLVDDDPAFKVPAIKKAVAKDHAAAVPQLVASLDDEDPAVRFYAIEGLRRLTGQTFDYHYYEDATTRQPAVDRWRAWLGEWSGQGRTAAGHPADVRSAYDRKPARPFDSDSTDDRPPAALPSGDIPSEDPRP